MLIIWLFVSLCIGFALGELPAVRRWAVRAAKRIEGRQP